MTVGRWDAQGSRGFACGRKKTRDLRSPEPSAVDRCSLSAPLDFRPKPRPKLQWLLGRFCRSIFKVSLFSARMAPFVMPLSCLEEAAWEVGGGIWEHRKLS